MKTHAKVWMIGVVCALLAGNSIAWAAVSAQEAEQLRTTLTPLGGEKAGNKEGTIPEWDGGFTKPPAGFKKGGRRVDPFSGEKPLVSITAENMDRHADKLTEATKVLLKKYPATFRVDVYPTHRTAAAPQWVYDNTLKNATRARLDGVNLHDAAGGVPFPIPKSGVEVMWNHEVRWRGVSWVDVNFGNWLVTASGQRVLLAEGDNRTQLPYYFQDGSFAEGDGTHFTVRTHTTGPALRMGENIVGRGNVDGTRDASWIYLVGQRRVRRVPNACCDTPTPFSAGVSTFDEVDVFNGASSSGRRFEWKILSKKEMYIPYNGNRLNLAKPQEIMGDHHLNPDLVRWELHRVWVVEATLKPGQRHTTPKSRYYVDEDSWIAMLADRWDGSGQLWRGLFNIPVTAPDIPATVTLNWGYYDLLSGSYLVTGLYTDPCRQHEPVSRIPDREFTPDALAAQGVR